ncbi:peptidase C14, caspase domain-containing protein [Zychaea mexicana]|uniref:peptidase C14, caspase domain-containing protein n=1 Tax=Zychaea mexicana TaxID=64656 RepID=UPI0022FEAEC1|nr:peptidase C14, caspase domain-containing protein [Zychaea mexicana]KAI9499254.1 peptidase C14, caspase domain-containing protein [Zychaea mexicana]
MSDTEEYASSMTTPPRTPVPTFRSETGLELHVHPLMKDQPAPDYVLSNCQGRKRALLIGINYFDTPNELKGCLNDVQNIKEFLIELYGFKEEDMRILTDDQTDDPLRMPTKVNILTSMQWLVEDAEENDSFFLHFSGHGGRVRDTSGDEYDGFDETIYPVDFDRYDEDSGQIIDDDMHDLLVRPLPAGARLTAIFDSCHSGTALDLPYIYSTQGEIKDHNLFKFASRRILHAGFAYATGDKENAKMFISELPSQLKEASTVARENRRTNSSRADVVMFSGCKDHQTSADAQDGEVATGAMSYAFTTTLRENPDQSYQELLVRLREILSEKYSQRPQMSSSHPIDVSLQFIC